MNNVRRIVNPIEWLAYIYGKVFVGYPLLVGYMVAVLIGGGGMALLWMRAIDKYREQRAAEPASDASRTDPERPDVHFFDVKLQINYDEEGNLLATSIAQVIRNLGKRTAIKVEVRMWLGYDAKPDMSGPPPVINYSIPFLEPGPYDPARNNYTTYLSGGWAKFPRDAGTAILPPFRLSGQGPHTVPPTPPPFGRKTYLIGSLAFDDSLTGRHYNHEVCFEQPFGWPEGRIFGGDGRMAAPISRCE